MITVALWAIVTKPIFNFVFLWIMDASHKASPFVGARIALDLGVALPLGAILGWLGEKRAIARITKKKGFHITRYPDIIYRHVIAPWRSLC